uniref:Fibronectin type-III domain-containing protein n=1 Tax=Dicentrarchus labrax TaxID=13489 RepID=A0A8C4IN48_DICLA
MTVSWIPNALPFNYSVIAVPLAGNISSVTCKTSHANCSLSGLQCGQTYNVSVKASSGTSCSPQSLTAVTDCGTNSLLASWNAAPGATSYTATVTGPNGFSETCFSSNLTCSFSSLQCASQYNITVTSQDSNCTSSPRPCDPVNVTSIYQCGSDKATVSWEAAAGAVAYTVHAQEGSSQHYSSCRSNTTSCQLNQLQCGKVYNLTVMAEDATCNSNTSTIDQNCSSNVLTVKWKQSSTEQNYTVQATSDSGVNTTCDSTESSCSFLDLSCGQLYTFTVMGHSNVIFPKMLNFTFNYPCAPMNLSVHYNVGSAQVMWGAARGASSYSVEGVTDQGSAVTCNTTNTNCSLNGLQCSQTYNITVMAHNMDCDSVISETYHLMTEPCPPTNVQANIACEQLTATVSWQQSDLAVGYVAYFENEIGHNTSCVGTDADTSCDVSGLMCGTVYSVWVKALGQQYNSSDSIGVSITPGKLDICRFTITYTNRNTYHFLVSVTADNGGMIDSCNTTNTTCSISNVTCGDTLRVQVTSVRAVHPSPCQPQGVRGNIDCVTNSAWISWDAAAGADSYTVIAVGGKDYTANCTTSSNTTCEVEDLACGVLYNFSVIAKNSKCESQPSAIIDLGTGNIYFDFVKQIC